MCLSFCHKRAGFIYFNHEDCSPIVCQHAGAPPSNHTCQTCCHGDQVNALCALTGRPLPKQNGCCHYNVKELTEPIVLQDENIWLLRVNETDQIKTLLREFDVPYTQQDDNILVSPQDFPLPDTYGLGTDHFEPERIEDDAGVSDITWNFDW